MNQKMYTNQMRLASYACRRLANVQKCLTKKNNSEITSKQANLLHKEQIRVHTYSCFYRPETKTDPKRIKVAQRILHPSYSQDLLMMTNLSLQEMQTSMPGT